VLYHSLANRAEMLKAMEHRRIFTCKGESQQENWQFRIGIPRSANESQANVEMHSVHSTRQLGKTDQGGKQNNSKISSPNFAADIRMYVAERIQA
jgi:hypothetical protein